MKLFFLLIDKYCLGYELLERGQSLVPLPPESITGNIFEFKFSRELVNLFKKLQFKDYWEHRLNW